MCFLLYIFHTDLVEFINMNYVEILRNTNSLLSKLLLDRLPLWLASIEQSNFLFANFNPISLVGYSTSISDEDWWSYGSHNFFIQLYFNIGLIGALLVFLLVNAFLFEIIFLLFKKNLNQALGEFFKSFYYILIVFVSIWNFLGNSLFESVGFLVFLIFGSIYSALKKT